MNKKSRRHIVDDTMEFLRNKKIKTKTDLGLLDESEVLKNLTNELKLAKKAVLQNVIRSHNLEATINKITEDTHEANRDLQSKLALHSTRQKRKCLGGDLNVYILNVLEDISDCCRGTGLIIMRAIAVYQDENLRQELSSFPVTQRKHLNAQMFGKIVWLTSGQTVSTLEGLSWYNQFEEYLQNQQLRQKRQDENDAFTSNTHTDTVINEEPTSTIVMLSRWEYLTNLLLKKIFILYLTREVYKQKDSLSLLQNNDRAQNLLIRQHVSSTPSAARSIKSITVPKSSAKKRQPSNMSSIGSTSVVARPPSTPTPKVTGGLSDLKSQLSKSQDLQKNLSSIIFSDMTKVSKTFNVSGNKSAFQFARQIGIRKMEACFLAKVQRLLRVAVDKWKEHVERDRLERSCVRFLKHMAVYRIFDALEVCMEKKLRRYLEHVQSKIRLYRELEELAARVEIQRVARGCIVRLRLRRIRRFIAATTVQALVRRFLIRIHAKDFIEKYRRHQASKVIHKIWKTYAFVRSITMTLVLLRRTRHARKIQNCYQNFKIHREYKRNRLLKLKIKSVIKIQSVWRRYQAVCLFTVLVKNKEVLKKIVTIQSVIRGFLGRLMAHDLREKHCKAIQLQCQYRCHLARKRLFLCKAAIAIVYIQKLVRGHLARKKVHVMMQARNVSKQRKKYFSNLLKRMIRGYVVRCRYLKMLFELHYRQEAAVIAIQRCFSRYLLVKEAKRVMQERREVKAEKERIERLRNDSASVIQRGCKAFLRRTAAKRVRDALEYVAAEIVQKMYRGRLGRLKAKLTRAEYELEISKKIVPQYFRLQATYIRDQNLFHRGYVLIIQCAWRKHVAYSRMMFKKKTKASKAIQRWWHRIIETWPAKCLLRKKKIRALQVRRAVRIISIILRAWVLKRPGRARIRNSILVWFMRKARIRHITKGTVQSFRNKKIAVVRAQASALVIQKHIRGTLARAMVGRKSKRLKYELEKRLYRKKIKAVITIQSFIRMVLAKKYTKRRRHLLERQREKQEKKKKFDESLDKVHETHLLNVSTTRIQTISREVVAKTKVVKKMEDIKAEEERKRKEYINKCVTRVQALTRGVLGRRRYYKMLPGLRRALTIRRLCSECERLEATKKCRNCRDQFCTACFTKIHKKGHRRKHDWTFVNESMSVAPAKPYGGLGKGTDYLPSSSGWEEFFDEATNRKYYYNTKTDETTWDRPVITQS